MLPPSSDHDHTEKIRPHHQPYSSAVGRCEGLFTSSFLRSVASLRQNRRGDPDFTERVETLKPEFASSESNCHHRQESTLRASTDLSGHLLFIRTPGNTEQLVSQTPFKPVT